MSKKVSENPLLTCSNPTQMNCNSLSRRRKPHRKRFPKPWVGGSNPSRPTIFSMFAAGPCSVSTGARNGPVAIPAAIPLSRK